ncbi:MULTISPECIES: hypothetical protein [Pseudofrankia]|uniref:hypothetical protein n=1 Tax=Pseudofrankia TaxID=2994363 RepID=UPI0003171D6A|nr:MULTISPECIES: hypothetical protein [Pseudofrankia]
MPSCHGAARQRAACYRGGLLPAPAPAAHRPLVARNPAPSRPRCVSGLARG